MPPIKRWFPVSHDINTDPEVVEFVGRFDLFGLKVWLQLLSVGDRNDGKVKGKPAEIASSMSWLYPSESRRYNTVWRSNECRMMFEWMSNRGWIEVEESAILICNHWKYHKTRERISSPPFLPNHPTRPLLREEGNKSRSPPSAQPKLKTAFPENFEPNPKIILWALEHDISEPQKEVEAFRDFHQSRGNRFLDWDAAFRTWLRNSKRFRNNGKQAEQVEGELSERTKRILRRGL